MVFIVGIVSKGIRDDFDESIPQDFAGMVASLSRSRDVVKVPHNLGCVPFFMEKLVMFEVSFNATAFAGKAKQLAGAAQDQVPYALSRAANAAALNTRQVLIQSTWPRRMTVRNPNFIGRALRIKFSTKDHLKVSIFDDLRRAHLDKHARGGVKKPRGTHLAIPVKGRIPTTPNGVPAAFRPRALIDGVPSRALRITPKGIFVGFGGRIHLFYVFATSARIKKDVNFIEDFTYSMSQEMRRNLISAVAEAIQGRK